jgi:hypothetical protein
MMRSTDGKKQLLLAYGAVIVAIAAWFAFMDSPTRDPRITALLLWLSASIVSMFFSYRALRHGSLLQRFLTLPLFLYYFGSWVFYMMLLTSPSGRQ